MPAQRPSENAQLGGRQRLIEAALRLAARKSSVSLLGLRELSREAGLNPNTFYRHFADMDELGTAIVEQLADEMRERRYAVRAEAPDFATFTQRSLEMYFEFAAEHPEAFVLGFRELSLPTAASRAIRRVMDEVADELAEVMVRQGLAAERDSAREIAGFVVSGLFLLAIEYIDRKAQRRAVLAKAQRYVALIVTGAAQLAPHGKKGHAPLLEPASAPAKKPPSRATRAANQR
jgi:AcrR family transcriptional regulator